MINPIMQTLSSTQSQNLANNISSFLKTVKNPVNLLQQMMSNNDPRLGELMNKIQESGGDPQKLARQLLAEQGIDADQLINKLK